MRTFNKYFNYYQFKDGTNNTKLVINFDRFDAINTTIKADDLQFFTSVFEYVDTDNTKLIKSTTKAYKLLNDLFQLEIDNNSRVDPLNKVIDKFTKVDLFIASKFLSYLFREYNIAYHVQKNIEDRLTRYNY